MASEVSQLQASYDAGLGSSAGSGADAAYGFLEGPHGVAELVRLGERVATGRVISRTIKTHDDLSCVFWKLQELEWSHTSGLMFLQGASIQQIVAPYRVLRASPRPCYVVRPGLDDVLLADLLVPTALSPVDLFVALTALAAGI